jgi:sugar lactone lactonase YvrE
VRRLFLVLSLLSACSDRPPHVILAVEDPEGIAAGAESLVVAPGGGSAKRWDRGARAFPVELTVTSPAAGVHALVVEAVAAGQVVARAYVSARFARRDPTTVNVRLGPPCAGDGDCFDGGYCDGVRVCSDGVCAPAAAPCPASAFACVAVSCDEPGRTCAVQVDHTLCPEIEGEPAYCDPTFGCVRGQGCQVAADCDDGVYCNGVEQCVGFRCLAGVPPSVDDTDPCTLDACIEPTGAAHFPDPGQDGQLCTQSGGGDGICLAGTCVDSVCGDGFVDNRTEHCEDANDDANDGCDRCRHTQWVATLLVGLGESGGSGTELGLDWPSDLIIDRRDNVYIADKQNHRIRRLDRTTGIITTVAGNGTRGAAGDGGPAGIAQLSYPYSVALDGLGNLFIADRDNHAVRRVDAQTGIITTIAGTFAPGDGGDGGPASLCQLRFPRGVAVDGLGNVFVADSENHRIRRIDAQGGIITTIAGSGVGTFSGEGTPAVDAQVNLPYRLCFDPNRNLLVADTGNHRIRRIDHLTGLISTVAGNGSGTFSGDGGLATAAALRNPYGIDTDAQGNLYIADSINNRIRRVDAGTGIIDTIAGNGDATFSGDGGPAMAAALWHPYRAAVDSAGAIWVLDQANQRVRRIDPTTRIITTVVGTGAVGYLGDGGPALLATLYYPYGLAFDPAGRLLVADKEHDRVRRVDLGTGVISTVAGTVQGFAGDNGPAVEARLFYPRGVGSDALGNIYIADGNNHRVRRVDASTGVITTVAGTGVADFAGDDGPATLAALNGPRQVLFDTQGRMLVADTLNGRVRRVDMATGLITTVAGGGSVVGDNGPATAARLQYPFHFDLDADDNLFIPDAYAARVRRVDAATNVITTVAGNGTAGYTGDDGQAVDAQLAMPYGVAVDGAGNFYIAELENQVIRRVDALSGVITTVAGTGNWGTDGDWGPATSAELSEPTDVRLDAAGDLLVADSLNHRVRRVDLDTGIISTVAGLVLSPGDGPLGHSMLGAPAQLARIAAGPQGGRWVVADGTLGRVRQLDLEAGILETRVGYPGGASLTDAAHGRLLEDAAGVAFDAVTRRVVLSERGRHTISYVDLDDDPLVLMPFAGLAGTAGYADGNAAASRFAAPAGLVVAPATRTLYVADSGNHLVRAVDLDDGSVRTVAGTPRTQGFYGEDEPALGALLYAPAAVGLGNDGSLYVADTGNHRVRRIDLAGNIATVLGEGTAASSGVGRPARALPVASPAGLALDARGNLFVTSRVSVRLVVAGADNLATGSDEVVTIYGAAPRDTFPEAVTYCLSGLALAPDATSEPDGRLFLLDACQGFLIDLHRERL